MCCLALTCDAPVPPHAQDTVTGFLLAGVGHRTASSTNFLVVKPDTATAVVEASFTDLTNREDIGIVLINQHVRRSTSRSCSSNARIEHRGFIYMKARVATHPPRHELASLTSPNGCRVFLSINILIAPFFRQVANDIRHLLKDYNKTIPTVLEIPSKDSPYDPEQDYIMQRVSQLIGGPS